MNQTDRAAFAETLGYLAAMYDTPLSPVRIEGYWRALNDLTLDELRAGADRAGRELKFFPKPAELRELAGYGAPDAGTVEAALLEHLRSLGGDRRMPDDPFLKLVVQRLGGLLAVVDMGVDRPRAIANILPGLVTAARVRGIPMPVEADHRPQLEYRPRIEVREPELPRGGADGPVRVGELVTAAVPKKGSR